MRKALSLLIVSLVAGLLPMSPAVAAPTIAFVNPSPLATGQVPELSDKGGNVVHLVAWAREIPSNAIVEFEIRSTTQVHTATIDATRVGSSDTWEGFFPIPDSFPDGTYTVFVRLFPGLLDPAVAEAEQTVTINQSNLPPPDPANTVEMNVPDNGGELGFFTPKGAATRTLITAVASEGTQQVRAVYTTSDPGETPTWSRCGSSSPGAGGITTIRCTLAEGDNPAAVTAVAVVANEAPSPAPAETATDEASDAHRIDPYVQTPSFVGMTPQSVQAESGDCQMITANVLDQLNRPISGANVDVHAQGPNDQLTFATVDPTPLTTTTHAYQAPEGHVSSKPTIRCSDGAQVSARQGVHRVISNPDRMHIESVNGTTNAGEFLFALSSPNDNSGPTNVIAWADVNDDDSQALSEASGQAQIGWDQAPPPPQREIFIDPDTSEAEIGTCRSLTIVVRDGGSPLVGQNIDIHISGPDATVAFCSPTGATPRRDPLDGGHVGGSHTDSNAKHAEGETDGTGRFVFGVTAAGEGRTNIVAWIDESEDDVQVAGEPAAPAHVTFEVDGDRSVSLQANKRRVRKGRRVRLTGSINGSAFCEADQKVKLKARRPNARWRNIATRTTGADGNFRFRPRVRRTKDYRVIAVKDGSCKRARSRVVRVRARG